MADSAAPATVVPAGRPPADDTPEPPTFWPERPPTSRFAKLSAPYSYHIPEPPVTMIRPDRETVVLDPSRATQDAASAVTSGLSPDDLARVTGMRVETAQSVLNDTWRYEMRRQVQPVTDFLSIGPWAAARDGEFLRREGYTMLLAVRDLRTVAGKFLAAERITKQFGLDLHCVDSDSPRALISGFDEAVKRINGHLIDMYRRTHGDGTGDGIIGQDGGGAGRRAGRVLIFCETGIERSATVTAAYLMATYNIDTIQAVQFVCCRRFCCVFHDEAQVLLNSWQDLLAARRAVAHDELLQSQESELSLSRQAGQEGAGPSAFEKRTTSPVPQRVAGQRRIATLPKRRIGDVAQEERATWAEMAESADGDASMDLDLEDDDPDGDAERFMNRQQFIPFRDRM